MCKVRHIKEATLLYYTYEVCPDLAWDYPVSWPRVDAFYIYTMLCLSISASASIHHRSGMNPVPPTAKDRDCGKPTIKT